MNADRFDLVSKQKANTAADVAEPELAK
jgi:hypothetical protein